MIRIQQIKLPLKHEPKDLEEKIRKLLRLKPGQDFTYRIWKQSVDARGKNEISYVYTVDVTMDQEEKLLHKIHNKNIMSTTYKPYLFTASGSTPLRQPPIIVGCGPAGLFCAYQLAKVGYRPLVIERGKRVEDRQVDVEHFWNTGILNPDSNVQFGEGGAGAFSDGKLNTLVKDPVGRNRYVLETLVGFGADGRILYENKPHIGTDVLVDVVRAMRQEIQRLGGSFLYETCLMDLQIEDGQIRGVCLKQDGKLVQKAAQLVVLAIGHSARDTFEWLYKKGVSMEAKAFAVGFRVEHPQELINTIQYKGADMHYLPPASYKVTANFENQRGVYSFCMCPGGYVVNASSEQGRLAVNGMSYQKRDGKNANSAIIVSVSPKDYPDTTPIGGLSFQRDLEEKAYGLGGGKIPQQLYGDFINRKITDSYGSFESQAKGATMFADLNELLDKELRSSFQRGMEAFGKKIPQFDRYDAILSGIESRTSSPVRIHRNADCLSPTGGLYPCGEGAGYAGGIMSAAMDGLKVAEAIASAYCPFG